MGRLTDSPLLPSLTDRAYLGTGSSVIRRYQRFHKLPETGTLNAPTAKHMREHNVRIGDPPPRPQSTIYTRGRGRARGRSTQLA